MEEVCGTELPEKVLNGLPGWRSFAKNHRTRKAEPENYSSGLVLRFDRAYPVVKKCALYVTGIYSGIDWNPSSLCYIITSLVRRRLTTPQLSYSPLRHPLP